MRGGGGTAGLGQNARSPRARRSVDLNRGGARARGNTQMDGAVEKSDDITQADGAKVSQATTEKTQSKCCTM